MSNPAPTTRFFSGNLFSVAAWTTFLEQQRWFASKGRDILAVEVEAASRPETGLVLLLVRVTVEPDDEETYFVPLWAVDGQQNGILSSENGDWVDALAHPEGVRALLRSICRYTGDDDLGWRTELLDPSLTDQGVVRLGSAQQSNSWAIVGDAFLKVFRRPVPGENLDVEVGRHLTESGFTYSPRLRAVASGRSMMGDCTLVSVLSAVPTSGSAWEEACKDAAASARGETVSVDRWQRLGRRTGLLHRALIAGKDPLFSARPAGSCDMSTAARSADLLARNVLEQLRSCQDELPSGSRDLAKQVLAKVSPLLDRLRAPAIAGGTLLIRVHGDYHLGQVLWDGSDWTLLDFEGEPARPLEERRRRHPAAKDLAGMIRSFDYAAKAGLPAQVDDASAQRALVWRDACIEAFLEGWRVEVAGTGLRPALFASERHLLDFYVAEKAFYELHYELGHRPDWAAIPLRGLLGLAG